MQRLQGVKQQVIQIPSDVLTWEGLTNSSWGDKDLTTPIENYTSSTGIQLPAQSNLAWRFKDATIAVASRNKTGYKDQVALDKRGIYRTCFQTVGAKKMGHVFVEDNLASRRSWLRD